MKNIIVVTDTEEQLQGIIRGIEALDTEHNIGILHGQHSMEIVDEACQLIAELANATLVMSPTITLQDVHKKHNTQLRTVYVDVPRDKTRDKIIEYMKEYYSDIVELITKD